MYAAKTVVAVALVAAATSAMAAPIADNSVSQSGALDLSALLSHVLETKRDVSQSGAFDLSELLSHVLETKRDVAQSGAFDLSALLSHVMETKRDATPDDSGAFSLSSLFKVFNLGGFGKREFDELLAREVADDSGAFSLSSLFKVFNLGGFGKREFDDLLARELDFRGLFNVDPNHFNWGPAMLGNTGKHEELLGRSPIDITDLERTRISPTLWPHLAFGRASLDELD